MKNLFSEMEEYFPFARSVIQRRMSYKIGFLMRIAGGLLQVLIMYYLWMAIFNSSSNGQIKGFTSTEMVVYIVISYITAQIININIEGTIAYEIRDGSVAVNLIRPISYKKRVFAESLGEVLLRSLTILLPLWIGFLAYRFVTIRELPPNIGTVLLFLISLFLGYMIMFLFNFIFGLSAFFVTYIWGFMVCKGVILRFFSGELIPIIFFPSAVQKALQYLPFSSINYTPVMIYMEKFTMNELISALCVQVVWVVILFVLMNVLWQSAIKRLTVLGG